MEETTTLTFKDTVLEVFEWAQSLEPPANNFKMDFKYEEVPGYKISLVFNKI